MAPRPLNQSSLDDLLQPSLAGAGQEASGKAPFNLSSLVYAAFFGGPFTVMMVSWLQARRLTPTPEERRQVYLLMAATLVVHLCTFGAGIINFDMADPDIRRGIRFGGQMIAVGGQILISRSLKRADRRHEMSARSERAGFFFPGLLMVVAGWAISIPILGLIIGLAGQS